LLLTKAARHWRSNLPIQPCPACRDPTPRRLDFTSDTATVNYYRCQCGHIWTASKKDGAIVHNVTPLPSSPKAPKKK